MALPAAVTTFVERDGELHDDQRLLRSAQLLTLVGPGGVGKTRLALEECVCARTPVTAQAASA